MIITCENCSKSFNIQESLIPNEGRELQCGSCGHKWFFKKSENKITFKNEMAGNSELNVPKHTGEEHHLEKS